MLNKPREDLPKCWSQRLWWFFLLIGLVAAYLVLRNFSMGFYVFFVFLLVFLGVGATTGHFIGTYIDNNHRSQKGLLRHERRLCKALLKWLTRIQRRKGYNLSASVLKPLEEHVFKLDRLLHFQDTDRMALREERRRSQHFVDDKLQHLKKSSIREYVESIGFAVVIALALRAFVIEAFQIPSGSMIPTLRVGDHIFVSKLSYGIRMPLLPMRLFGKRIPAIAWNWSTPKPGDVIVFITPETEEEDYIKRVVAVEGDWIEVVGGKITVNGKSYPQSNITSFKYNRLEGGRFNGVVSTKRIQEISGDSTHFILRKACSNHRDCDSYHNASSYDPTRGQLTEFGCNFDTGTCRERNFGPYHVPEDHVFVMGDNRDNSRDSRILGPVPVELIKGRAIFIWWSYRERQVQWDRMFTKIR